MLKMKGHWKDKLYLEVNISSLFASHLLLNSNDDLGIVDEKNNCFDYFEGDDSQEKLCTISLWHTNKIGWNGAKPSK